MNQVLISCDPEFRGMAMEELRELLPKDAEPVWLDEGLALLPIASGFDEFAEAVREAGPAFVRHIAPVDAAVTLTAAPADLDVLTKAAEGLAGRLDPALSFSVQSRILGEGKLPYRKVTINETLSTMLERKTGAKMDCRNPAQVVTVVCTPTQGFIGVSRTGQNRSAWPGGMHRFKEESGQVSRSEHKLLEALSLFGLELPEGGTALDLGASPGGWTRVLRERGMKVVAVDPADLDPRVARDPGVVHVRRQTNDYLAQLERESPGTRFDAIVNDMRMDGAASVEIMRQARGYLKPGGVGVITIKIREEDRSARRTPGTIRKLVARLAEAYSVVGVRQLWHNRSEVTVALRAG